MELFPAIDLKDGNVVRLTQGDYDKKMIYSDSPLTIAKQFVADGAKNLHIVDLDGAKDGELVNHDIIKEIADKCDLFIQVGGGIRDESRIKQYLDAGVGRVILGTIAVKDKAFLQDMVNKYGDAIAVGVDAKDGMVAINGWREITDIGAIDFIHELWEMGVATVICTDISKDGLLSGTNLALYEVLSNIPINIVASGGISYEDEITKLCDMEVYAAIVGKSLYEGKLELSRIIELAKGE